MLNYRIAALFAGSSLLLAQQKTAPKAELHFDDPRVVRASEKTIIPIYLCDLQGAEITLPKGELLRMPTVGDPTNWTVTAVPEDRRDISIRPNEPMTKETILNVTSDHDNRYVFRLILGAGHCDSHVSLEADQSLQQRIATEDPWVPPSKYKEALNAAEEARKQLAETKAQAVKTADAVRADYPKDLSFDYVFDSKEADKFGVKAIFHDSRFTYIRVLSSEPPVLFERKDKQPSMIEVEYDRGLYRTARVIDEAYLVRGGKGDGKHQERFEFKRDPKLSSAVDQSRNGG